MRDHLYDYFAWIDSLGDRLPMVSAGECEDDRKVGYWTVDYWTLEFLKLLIKKQKEKDMVGDKKGSERKKKVLRCYMNYMRQQRLCYEAQETTDSPLSEQLPSPNWLALEVEFKLLAPWYSRDERVFHLLDNPLHKDRICKVPFIPASAWKGMLRWGCRMQAGLYAHLKSGRPFSEWQDPPWILHLFGNAKGAEESHRGALAFYPTWFNKVGFEVINPHSRERRAGRNPIYYEVVPINATGTLRLLYAPLPGMPRDLRFQEFLPNLLQAIETLLTTYGISAKRTAGWGTAEIEKWAIYRSAQPGIVVSYEKGSWRKFWEKIQGSLER